MIARQAVESINANPFAAEILAGATVQAAVVCEATEPETGTPCLVKGRLDIVPSSSGAYRDWIFDLKTCASLGKIESSIADFGYHAQAGLYLDLYNNAAQVSHKRTRFGFVFGESEDPYEVAVVELDPADIQAGREWFAKALALWCRCRRDNHFPSRYEDEIRVVSRPKWAKE